jgi:adenosylmethionine-8-amino-7-oxononanoate aminotransferase
MSSLGSSPASSSASSSPSSSAIGPAADPAALIARDARVLWHPYTQHASEPLPIAVAGANGATLRLADGREVLDAISSWWTVLHGHAEARIVAAIERQARVLDHVLFAGATHAPAVELAERLLEIAPRAPGRRALGRVFYSDDGSTAVEVALKIALQSWSQRGQDAQGIRRVFVSFEGAYHGDTFGAMSVGDPDPFFRPFEPLLFEARRVPPELGALAAVLDDLGDRAAGVIVEPLVQGAGGMRMHGAELLRDARAACDVRGLPLIADEVMTGFGRTGALFACTRAGVVPDLLCIAKGLSGGILPLAATLATEELFQAFLHPARSRALSHGHSFTANPIACAAALASLELALERDVGARFERLGASIESELRALLAGRPEAASLRRTGSIVAFDLADHAGATRGGYFAARAPLLRQRALELGVLLRPLGNVVYAMPPACTTERECRRIAEVMAALAAD